MRPDGELWPGRPDASSGDGLNSCTTPFAHNGHAHPITRRELAEQRGVIMAGRRLVAQISDTRN